MQKLSSISGVDANDECYNKHSSEHIEQDRDMQFHEGHSYIDVRSNCCDCVLLKGHIHINSLRTAQQHSICSDALELVYKHVLHVRYLWSLAANTDGCAAAATLRLLALQSHRKP